MKYRILLILLLAFGCISLKGGETNSYQSITKRNAFDLTASLPVLTLPPVSNILSTDIFLTGISRLNGVRKVHLVLKRIGEPNKYVSLVADQKQYNIKLNKILDDSVEITKDGVPTLLSFEKNGLPSIITKSTSKLTERGKYSKDKSSKEKASTPKPTSGPKIVPSRKSRSQARQVDPRVLERGLEYINKIDDPEKKEYILQRLEKYQRGEHDSDKRKK